MATLTRRAGKVSARPEPGETPQRMDWEVRMRTQRKTASWLNDVRHRTAFDVRHRKLGGDYRLEARVFAGWVALGVGDTYQEASRKARQNPDYEKRWREGCDIRVVAENELGLWVLGTDGIWFQAESAERGRAA